MVCSIKFQKLWTKTMRLKFFFAAKHILLENELVMVVHFSFIDILGIIFCHLLNAFTIHPVPRNLKYQKWMPMESVGAECQDTL